MTLRKERFLDLIEIVYDDFRIIKEAASNEIKFI